MHAARAMRYWTDPWARTLHVRYHSVLDAVWGIEVHKAITRDLLHCIREQPVGTLAVFHYPSPHYPYVRSEDGQYRTPLSVGWDYEDLQAYDRALIGMDRTVGEVIAAMREAGRFDNALLILTSDHAWKWNPKRKSGKLRTSLTHVPLMVKLPRQRQGLAVHMPFETRAIHTIVNEAIAGKMNFEDLDGFVKQVLALRSPSSPPENLAAR